MAQQGAKKTRAFFKKQAIKSKNVEDLGKKLYFVRGVLTFIILKYSVYDTKVYLNYLKNCRFLINWMLIKITFGK